MSLFLIVALRSAYAGGVSAASTVYPLKPVRIIVPLAPGGGSDIVGRIVAAALSGYWGRSVVVDNRPGAGSTVGSAIAADSPADGYTLLVSSSSIAISPALYKELAFDVKRDFAGISMIASQPSVLAVSSSVPVTTLQELIAYAKAHPDSLTYGSAGVGSATHLGTELLKYTAGIKILHVPYKSAGLATTSLLGGETQVLLTNMASVLPHRDSGKIKLVAVSSPKRLSIAPAIYASGKRLARVRVRHLVWHARACRDAAKCNCTASWGYREGDQSVSCPGAVCSPGIRRIRDQPGGIQRLSRS